MRAGARLQLDRRLYRRARRLRPWPQAMARFRRSRSIRPPESTTWTAGSRVAPAASTCSRACSCSASRATGCGPVSRAARPLVRRLWCCDHHDRAWNQHRLARDSPPPRAGFVVGDKLLLYGKGGLAIAQERHAVNLNQIRPRDQVCYRIDLGAKAVHTGLVVGAGAEYALGGNWSAKVEYDYIRMSGQAFTAPGTQTVNAPPQVGSIDVSRIVQQDAAGPAVDQIRCQLSLQFDAGGGGGKVLKSQRAGATSPSLPAAVFALVQRPH